MGKNKAKKKGARCRKCGKAGRACKCPKAAKQGQGGGGGKKAGKQGHQGTPGKGGGKLFDDASMPPELQFVNASCADNKAKNERGTRWQQRVVFPSLPRASKISLRLARRTVDTSPRRRGRDGDPAPTARSARHHHPVGR